MPTRKDVAAPPPAPSTTTTGTLAAPKRRLGRGLDSLISAPVRVEIPPATAAPEHRVQAALEPRPMSHQSHPAATDNESAVRMVAVELLQPNRHQPRQDFDEAAMESLAASIRSAGLMQPILVRPANAGRFEIIAGERRWRAAQRIGLHEVPALVRAVDDQAATEMALIENLQREDLNPIERAEAFARLAVDFGLTHQQVAERVSLDRTSVTNLLRLLELDQTTKDAVRKGQLSLGHARALLAIANSTQRQQLAVQSIRQGWSVRELERRARQSSERTKPQPDVRLARSHTDDLQRRLSEHLATKVHIQPGRKKGTGRVVIEFFSLDEFEGLMDRMGFSMD